MIDQKRLLEAIREYKTEFDAKHWSDEGYKWEAVKCFQENWDLHAPDFAEMLTRSLSKTVNLLTSMNYFPRAMIEGFAKAAPEETRAAFAYLFDESKDFMERVVFFRSKAEEFLTEYGNGAKQHYQTDNAISTYLWLRYPDKYYIYKYSEAKDIAKYLLGSYTFKKGAYADNMRNCILLYDEISAALQVDSEMTRLLREHITEDCYPDPMCRSLAIDLGFFVSRTIVPQMEDVTYLSEIVASLKELGGKGHLSDILDTMKKRAILPSIRTNPNWDRAVSRTIQSHCSETQTYREGAEDIFYSVDGLGSGVWGLRENDVNPEPEPEWYPSDYTPGFSVRDWIDLINNREIFNETSLLIMKRILDIGGQATCTQLSEKYGESANFYNSGSSSLARRIAQKTNCPVHIRDNGDKRWWAILYVGKDADSNTPGIYVWKLRDELRRALEQVDLSDIDLNRRDDPYTKSNFLAEVYMSSENFDTLCTLLRHKKSLILQGAPGVGKTFAAKRLAYAMMGEKDESRVGFVQFHQNYSYEDFVMGYKPDGDGFKLTEGIFYSFCQKASQDEGRDYYFIIDEINRGNMSKIFGELLMLIENDYRNKPITLAYTQKPFAVPGNLYIIGMMNTADRSLAMIDYALRRRFSFYDMRPGFDTEAFCNYQNSIGSETLDALISCICELNRRIIKDPTLGEGFCIGHSYFCKLEGCDEDHLKAIAYYDILPMLREYWFDDPEKVNEWEGRIARCFE